MPHNVFRALRVYGDQVTGLKPNINASTTNVMNLNKLLIPNTHRKNVSYVRSISHSFKTIHYNSFQNIRCVRLSTLAEPQSVLENKSTNNVTHNFSKDSLDPITYKKFFFDFKCYPNYDR